MLHNDFPQRLSELDSAIRAIPNLWVLSGCDIDQRCWSSEGLGSTALSHFIIKALRDETQAAGSDRRLTLDDLYRYVRDNVRNWAWNSRGALQEPVLLPRGDTADAKRKSAPATRKDELRKVHLAMVRSARMPEPIAELNSEALRREWEPYRALDALVPHPRVYSPRQWREYRSTLTRLDELTRARAAADQLEGIRLRLRSLEGKIRNARLLTQVSESAENNLVMNAIRGGVVEPGPAAVQPLAFWQAPGLPRPRSNGKRSTPTSPCPRAPKSARCGAGSRTTCSSAPWRNP